MTHESLAEEVSRELTRREEKIVLAESCTAGMIASTLGGIPGISNYMCGSHVVYRADAKRRWLGVKKRTIKKHTTESHKTAVEMAVGALMRTPEANWSVSVVGHLGPDAPEEKDGVLYICIARRTKKNNIKIADMIEHKLSKDSRIRRQQQATESVLTFFVRCLSRKTQQEQAAAGAAAKKKKKVVA